MNPPTPQKPVRSLLVGISGNPATLGPIRPSPKDIAASSLRGTQAGPACISAHCLPGHSMRGEAFHVVSCKPISTSPFPLGLTSRHGAFRPRGASGSSYANDKSHRLIALSVEAARAGLRVNCFLATKLVNELVEAADEKVLAKNAACYGRVDLLCIDELRCMELNTVVALLAEPPRGRNRLLRPRPVLRRRRPDRRPASRPGHGPIASLAQPQRGRRAVRHPPPHLPVGHHTWAGPAARAADPRQRPAARIALADRPPLR